MEIDEGMVAQACKIWSKNDDKLSENVVLAAVAILAQVGTRGRIVRMEISTFMI